MRSPTAWILTAGLSALLQAAAAAQATDAAPGLGASAQGGAPLRSASPPAPVRSSHAPGSAKAILVPFGPYITQTGMGSGGADVSELYSTFTLGATGYGVFGFGMQSSVSNTVADDFTVPAGPSWTVSAVQWLAYQTGASTAGTVTSMNLNLWTADPLGQAPGGQSVAGGNQFQSNAWTGVYRVLDSGLLATNRALIEVTCGGAWLPALAPATYWLEANAGGTLTSGPWASPKVVAGQTPPTGSPWNARQSVSAGAFAALYDTGNPIGSINEPIDFLFQLEGLAGGGSVSPFCTSKTSSLGCTPTLAATSATVGKTGTPGNVLTAAPVPGGSGLPGIVLYSKNAPTAPTLTPFGFLCLGSFARAGAFPATPGGTGGACNGTYTFDLGAIVAATPAIVPGDALRIQVWYRDPGFPPPGSANFTHGIDAVAVSVGSGPPPLTGGTITPSSGGEGTIVTVTGTGFGTAPGDLKVLLADGLGFADVTAASDTQLSATVFKVGQTGVGPFTVIRGVGVPLLGQNVTAGGISSSSAQVHMVLQGFSATSAVTYTLAPGSNNTVSGKIVRTSGADTIELRVDLAPLTGNKLVYQLAYDLGNEYRTFEGEITFAATPTSAQRATHLAEHINTSFGGQSIAASSGGSIVQVSMEGVVYGGIVVSGI